MRFPFGRLVDREIGLLESRVAPVIARLFGGFVIISPAPSSSTPPTPLAMFEPE